MKRYAIRFVNVALALLLLITATLPLYSCSNKKGDTNMYCEEKLLPIVPVPKEVKLVGSSEKYVIYELEPSITTDDADFKPFVNTFRNYAKKINGVTLKNEEGGIVLVRDEKLAPGEYKIETSKDGMIVSASDNDGITYALATLHQILTVKDGVITVPSYTIKDKPDSSYRALMVDLARQWHPFNTLKDYIDLCYLYKIKFIHLHFTDTQSYTLPSDAFPKLSTKGRSYTKEEIASLNEYASDRNIEIIPEIEVPGHAACLTAAYPELFSNTPISGGTDRNIICAGKPGIMDTLKTLFGELIEMFPNSRYIHVGGDEANISDWENCSDCVAYMEKEGINGKYPLYTRFVKDITDMILSMGKTPVVWEGFPKEGAETISRDVIVTAWESLYHLPNDLIEEGFTVTNSSWLPLYIVPPTHPHVTGGRWLPKDILKWNKFTWRNWWDKSAAYKEPIVVEPTDQVIGGTLCAWECNYDQDIQPVKQNLAALSERLWNANGTFDTKEMLDALARLYTLADKVIDKK
ncbi:MAG: family 20 glycosylhydrolase [Clostridia bacterium]|nr:family 20 glycosylhydrolase [Clostridia bacterium]